MKSLWTNPPVRYALIVGLLVLLVIGVALLIGAYFRGSNP